VRSHSLCGVGPNTLLHVCVFYHACASAVPPAHLHRIHTQLHECSYRLVDESIWPDDEQTREPLQVSIFCAEREGALPHVS
jgi:hypothetical protein